METDTRHGLNLRMWLWSGVAQLVRCGVPSRAVSETLGEKAWLMVDVYWRGRYCLWLQLSGGIRGLQKSNNVKWRSSLPKVRVCASQTWTWQVSAFRDHTGSWLINMALAWACLSRSSAPMSSDTTILSGVLGNIVKVFPCPNMNYLVWFSANTCYVDFD